MLQDTFFIRSFLYDERMKHFFEGEQLRHPAKQSIEKKCFSAAKTAESILDGLFAVQNHYFSPFAISQFFPNSVDQDGVALCTSFHNPPHAFLS